MIGKNFALTFRRYYASLSNEEKKKFRKEFSQRSGRGQTSFYNKMRFWTFNPLELDLLEYLMSETHDNA